MSARGAVAARARSGRRTRRYMRTALCGCSCLIVISVLLAACGTSTPSLPKVSGGVYTSVKFHFTVTYPDGWQAHEVQGSAPSTAIPLTVIFTRTGDAQENGALISTLTVTVMNAHDSAIAQGIAALQSQAHAPNSALTVVTLAGQSALQAPQVKQQLPDSRLSATHTDYFLILKDFEFQVSTDAVDGDGAEPALRSMLQSFALTR